MVHELAPTQTRLARPLKRLAAYGLLESFEPEVIEKLERDPPRRRLGAYT
jgi:hypothetical protein